MCEPVDIVYLPARSPFDRQDADLLLRSMDKVEFRSHRQILAIASPVFEAMLTLPHPVTASSDDLKIIDVVEDSATVEALLRVCYPVEDPVVKTFELAQAILKAAFKYDMCVGIAFSKRILEGFVKAQPLRVYALSCLFQLEDVAKLAAVQAAVRRNAKEIYVAEFEELSASCYYRLSQFQRILFGNPSKFTFCLFKNGSAEAGKLSLVMSTKSTVTDPPTPFDNPDADTIIVSSDNVGFRVYRNIISLASPVLREMLEIERPDHISGEKSRPVLCIEEDSGTLFPLLQLCYPSLGAPETYNMHELSSVLCAARKYKIDRALRVLLRRWSELTASDPLRSYLLASAYGWNEQAVSAAKLLLCQDYQQLQDTYMPEILEAAPAGPYSRLLQCHRKCGEVASRFTYQEFTWVPDDLKDVWKCSACTPSVSQGSSWIRGYAYKAAQFLRERPSGTVITDGPVFAEIVRMVSECDSCLQRIQQILAFNSAFAHAIDNEVAKIDPEMLFKTGM